MRVLTNPSLAKLDIRIDRWIILLDPHMIMMTVIQNVFEVLYRLILEILHTADLPTMTMVHLPAIMTDPLHH